VEKKIVKKERKKLWRICHWEEGGRKAYTM